MSFLTKLAGDVTGASEVGKVIPRANFGAEDSIKSYVPSTESALIFIKSGVKEFIFTEYALVISVKSKSLSSKRNIIRLPYSSELISGVSITTPGYGVTDLDLELAFTMGAYKFEEAGNTEINLWKSELDRAMEVYHAVNAIAEEQKKRAILLQLLQGSSTITTESAVTALKVVAGSYKDVILPFAK